MTNNATTQKVIMRLFHARAKPGCAAELRKKFAVTSVDVVQNEPGNRGYFFGQGEGPDEDVVVFASFWDDLAAVKRRFGSAWQESLLPDGYDELIEECWVQHIDVGAGWFVQSEQFS